MSIGEFLLGVLTVLGAMLLLGVVILWLVYFWEVIDRWRHGGDA